MATPLAQWLEKATFLPDDLEGGANGGMLSPAQARTFLRDAIEATAILSRSDVFDSGAPKFEVPKISFANRIMRAGTSGSRVGDSDRQEPDTGLVVLSTELFKGEVPVGDEVFEDNVERAGLADTLMALIAEAVGRDLEEIAIKSNEASATADFAVLPDGGLIQQLVDANENVHDATSDGTYKAMFSNMLAELPSRYRRLWDRLVYYVPVHVADGYSDELGERGTDLGDSNVDSKRLPRYRGIPVVEVPLLSGGDNIDSTVGDDIDYADFAILCEPRNLKAGFHRRVRVEKYRDPREGLTSFLPTVRFDVKWAQDTAVVLAENVPAL